jgi:hypothetical protein
MLKKLSLGAVAAASLSLITATPAGADAGPTAAYGGGAVVVHGDTASVRIVYTCGTAEDPANHLFVAVKQGGGVSPDNASSDTVDLTAFYSTNWSVDTGPNALTCDGQRHQQWVVVKPQGPGSLHSGDVLVQVCVFDDFGFSTPYTMQHAVLAGRS